MAGHRKKHGRQSRPEARRDRCRAALAAAKTAEDQLAAAFDWFRMAVSWSAEPDSERLQVIREEAQHLAAIADEWDEKSIRANVVFPGGRGRGVTDSGRS